MDISAATKQFSAWCEFSDARVHVRYIPRHELREIYAAATNVEIVKGAKYEQFDSNMADLLLGRAAVLGWEGFTDGEDPFPCTPENIDLLMRNYNDFAKFVNDICANIDALVEERKAAERKNSGSSSGPSSNTAA